MYERPAPTLAKPQNTPHLGRMTEITARLSTALAERYRIERVKQMREMTS